MPRELPSQPSLEHLKKQAKILLRDLHQKKAEAIEKFSSVRLKSGPRLPDAQFLIASEYGFPSWQKLKEHVESLAAATTHPIEAAKKRSTRTTRPPYAAFLNAIPG